MSMLRRWIALAALMASSALCDAHPQAEASALASRLGDRDSVAWIEGKVLTIVHRDPRNAASMAATFSQSASRVPGSELWMVRLERRDWSEVFFSLPGGERFVGPKAPRLPTRASALSGQIVERTLDSVHLKESRGVTVYLPPNAATQDLPVMFMGDGQACAAYARVAEPLILEGRVAPFAIVGVHAPAHVPGRDQRAHEYIARIDAVTAAAHMQFFVEEVMPWATREFGFSTRRADRAIFGFSNSAVFAASVAIEHGKLFGHALPFSLGILPLEPSGHRSYPEFYFAAGRLEPVFHSRTSELHHLVKRWGAQSTFRDYLSGHDPLVWQTALATYLPRMFPPDRR